MKSKPRDFHHPTMDVKAYIGLGSNLDDPQSQLMRAFEELNQIPQTRCLKRSRLYISKPIGPQDQPDYLNAVAGLLTRLDAHSLLEQLQRIERNHGRVRAGRWGPRTLDLDLLLYGDKAIETPDLRVPHPLMHQRLFVLLPLQDIAPDRSIPGRGSLSELIAVCPAGGVKLHASA